MFLLASVILHGWVSVEIPWTETHPLDRDRPAVTWRAVRILLECILVFEDLLPAFKPR